jgi:hypothetical protein
MLSKTQNQHRFARQAKLLAVCVIALFAMRAPLFGAIFIPAGVGFTSIADRLLEQQLGLRLTQIQIAPTNQYDTAVHRIFQVTANLFSTEVFPTVFRPVFETRSNGVFLAAFTNDNRVSTLQGWLNANPYGLPIVVSARKGFPNFNEFVTLSEFTVSRRLELTRLATNLPPNDTNVMYTLSVSNLNMVELWNSYQVAYPRAATITVSNFTTLMITNELGLVHQTAASSAMITNLAPNAWPGMSQNNLSFVVPQMGTNALLTNSIYRFAQNNFELPGLNGFEATPGFPIPSWTMTLSNRLRCLISEGDNIVDWVQVNGHWNFNVNAELLNGQDPYPFAPAAILGLWSTNQTSGSPGLPDGILQQIDISANQFPYQTSLTDWRNYSATSFVTENDRAAAMRAFRDFLKLPPNPGDPPVVPSSALSMIAPFNPGAKFSVARVWQVNDPLVHFEKDLRSSTTNHHCLLTQSATNTGEATLGRLNGSYSPWWGNPISSSFPEPSNRALKDAGVSSSDRWNFPTNQTPFGLELLARFHRGTPWQTLYLQADVAPMAAWIQSGGDPRTHPTNDWRIAELLAALFKDVRTLRSVNTTNFDAWAATLDGLTVLSNNLANPQLFDPPQFESIVVTSNAPQVDIVVNAIQHTRAARRGQYFEDVASLFSISELSSASPWLNLSSAEQLQYGLTDEAYEALTSQLLALVRPDPVVTATRNGSTIELRFTVFRTGSYRVESSADLMTWTTFSDGHVPNRGTFSLTVPAASAPRFFRVILP